MPEILFSFAFVLFFGGTGYCIFLFKESITVTIDFYGNKLNTG